MGGCKGICKRRVVANQGQTTTARSKFKFRCIQPLIITNRRSQSCVLVSFWPCFKLCLYFFRAILSLPSRLKCSSAASTSIHRAARLISSTLRTHQRKSVRKRSPKLIFQRSSFRSNMATVACLCSSIRPLKMPLEHLCCTCEAPPGSKSNVF